MNRDMQDVAVRHPALRLWRSPFILHFSEAVLHFSEAVLHFREPSCITVRHPALQ
jgi:hypothetical protein